MKKDKIKRKIVLDSDFLLKIYAIVGAIVIWFILSITLFSSIDKTIYNVPVTINTETNSAKNFDLEIIDFDNETVDVKVSGKRYEIGDLKPEDLEATITVIGVTSAGEFPLDVVVRSKSGKDLDIVSVSRQTINVEFDKIMTKSFPISAEVPLYTVPTDYIQETPIANPSTVEITGSKQQIARIDRVVARTEDKETITSSVSIPISELMLYDIDNVKLDNSQFTFDTNKFSIDMKVNKVKELPFNVEIRNAPPNFDLSSLSFDYSQKIIKIAGEESTIDSMNAIHLDYIDLRNVSMYSTFDFNVILDTGITNLSDITQVNISVDSMNLAQKVFSITKDQIHVIGIPAQYDVAVQNVGIPNITLVGPENIISKITSEDIIAEVDLSKEEIIPNNYQMIAQIYCPNYDTIWSYGVKDVNITVSEKQE